jgi:hypothetical protein
MSKNKTNTVDCECSCHGTQNTQQQVVYHAAFDDATFACFAVNAGEDPSRLRAAIRMALHTRLNQARIKHPSHTAGEDRPNVYSLPVNSVTVHFSYEPALVVRGFSWEPKREPFDDWEGGGFFN